MLAADGVGDEDLSAFGSRAEPGCQLDRRAEQVVAVLDRLSGIEPDADMDRLDIAAVVASKACWISMAQSTEFEVSGKDAMMPSPRCFTSRPPKRLRQRRTRES